METLPWRVRSGQIYLCVDKYNITPGPKVGQQLQNNDRGDATVIETQFELSHRRLHRSAENEINNCMWLTDGFMELHLRRYSREGEKHSVLFCNTENHLILYQLLCLRELVFTGSTIGLSPKQLRKKKHIQSSNIHQV